MKKFFLLIVLACLPFCLFSQTTEKKYYLYNILVVKYNITYANYYIQLDNGETVGNVKDKDGNKITFRTPAAMLTYFLNNGWEIYSKETDVWGDYKDEKGSITPATYIIIRKECSKEEVEEANQRGIKHKHH